jgi:purine-nucleoside phosphorylase
MPEFLTREKFEEAAAAIRARTRHRPTIGIVLGSGLGGLAEHVVEAEIINSVDIPHWPRSTVEGHVGRLVVGRLEGQVVLIQQGRAHYYEGLSMQQVTLPIRVMQVLGLETVILTNAAGAINPDYQPGELMLIQDHINFLGMAGVSPLRGPNDPSFGPRFPDMSRAYDPGLRRLALETAKAQNLTLHHGVYVGLAGPSFETPADLRFLRMVGADAVGMSTVAETTLARHGGMRVLGISGISNKANLDGDTTTSHEEVLAAGLTLVPQLTSLLTGVLRRWPTPLRE